MASMQPDYSTRDIRAHLEEVLRLKVSRRSCQPRHRCRSGGSIRTGRNRASGAGDGIPVVFPLMLFGFKIRDAGNRQVQEPKAGFT